MNGAGTPSDPFQIVTAEDLARASGAYHYKVMNDINLKSYSNWYPVKVSDGAVIDGNGKAISGLQISRTTSTTPVGLFGENRGTIKNLRIDYGSVEGKDETGAFVGRNYGIIQKCGVCYVNTCEGGNYVGLFVGNNEGLIEDCFSTGNSYTRNAGYIGGFVGRNTGTIRRSYCAVSVYSSISTSLDRGGFVGYYAGGTIELCAHDTSVNNGLPDIGGPSSQKDLSGVYGLDSSSMKNKNVAPFTSWDFDTTWQIGTANYNNSYFIHQYIQPVVEDRTVTSFIKQI